MSANPQTWGVAGRGDFFAREVQPPHFSWNPYEEFIDHGGKARVPTKYGMPLFSQDLNGRLGGVRFYRRDRLRVQPMIIQQDEMIPPFGFA
jgi:hypothetical protein